MCLHPPHVLPRPVFPGTIRLSLFDLDLISDLNVGFVGLNVELVQIYIASGYRAPDSSGILATITVYDIATDTYDTSLPDMPGGGRHLGAGVTVAGTLYVVGGSNTDSAAVDTAEVPQSVALPPLSIPHRHRRRSDDDDDRRARGERRASEPRRDASRTRAGVTFGPQHPRHSNERKTACLFSFCFSFLSSDYRDRARPEIPMMRGVGRAMGARHRSFRETRRTAQPVSPSRTRDVRLASTPFPCFAV